MSDMPELCLRLANVPLGLVCNLLWLADTVPGSSQKLSRQAMAKRARLEGCDRLVLAKDRFACLKLARIRDLALTSPSLEASGRCRGKRLSLAVLALRVQEEGVLVLTLQAEDGPLYWVWAAHKGTISAQGDRVFRSFDRALALARGIARGLGLEEPRVRDARESHDFLVQCARLGQKAGDAAIVPLEPVSPGRVVLLFLLCLAAAGLLIGGQTMWEWWETRARTSLLSQTRGELAKKRADIARHPEKYFDTSWQREPSAATFVRAVLPDMLLFPLVGNGWTLHSLTGTATGLSARWKALPSTILLYPPEGAVNEEKNPGFATQSIPRRALLGKGSLAREDLLDMDMARRLLGEIATRLGLRLRISVKKPEFVMVGETRVEAPWVKARVSLEGIPDYAVSDYQALAHALDIRGLSLKSVTWEGRVWKMAATLVVKR